MEKLEEDKIVECAWEIVWHNSDWKGDVNEKIWKV